MQYRCVHDLKLTSQLPLTAIRAFEAAARHRNFKLAADELRLIPSAVSHQIRQLELLLQRPLFERGRRGVELTAVGAELAGSAVEAFDILRRAAARAIANPALLRLSAPPVFARHFLLPHLHDFERRWPEVDLRLEVSLALADIARGQADVGIRFGEGPWSGLSCERLLEAKVGPVCSPMLMPVDAPIEALEDQTVINIALQRDGWARWLSAAGRPALRPRRELWYDSLASAIDAARDGVGVALAPGIFVKQDLASGHLVAPYATLLAIPSAYHAVCRRGEEELGNIRACLRWLREAVKKES